jgi:pyruvate dehydrogenase E2 component (dihydrolipoamide acetyltransferase)
MSTEVLMPQMGESIAEGTIVRWIKKVGDKIDRDEPLFEISTDKVDAEIPSPGAGVLLEIKVNEGDTVPVNSIVALIGAEDEQVKSAPAPSPSAASAQGDGTREATKDAQSALGSIDEGQGRPASPGAAVGGGPSTAPTLADLRRTRSSPVVRKIAKDHHVDFTRLNGTGISGRVTKKDILAYVEGTAGARPSTGQTLPATKTRPAAPPAPKPFAPGENVRIEKMSVMRKKIAEHMAMSLQTSAHVYSVYEVNFQRIEQLRQGKRAEYERAGARLTYTAFIAKATIDTIRQFPFANASLDGENVVYKRDINLGIAVALDAGLIVPVIKDAAGHSVLGLAKAIQDLAQRARTKQLKPEDVQGGTFTITNPGIFGALFGLPIINQPQVAILGVGEIEKRVVVVDDMIAIRPMCYLSLGHDHRLIDGADAGRFLQALKDHLENFDEGCL